MNMLVASFWEGLLHATGFAMLAIVVYLALRRWSPAVGALAAGSSLCVMAMVAILAFCPWPRWDPGRSLETLRRKIVNSDSQRDAEGSIKVSASSTGSVDTMRPSVGRERWSQPLSRGKPSMVFALIQTLAREWGNPPAIQSRVTWSWTNWLALAMVGSMALGLIRLASGLWAIRRLRSRSQPLADPALIDTVALLRAEMGCLHAVEVRSSTELATPATIGWNRTLILLPQDWQTWNDAERRAVLAHELAHVCRGDFVTGLLAQLSVALQFYHPLAHWLSARLRLEQELAADAWSAMISGGSQPYLTTLAQMALRRDDRALSWPARAFLPSRGTFVRRIEMLRDSTRVRHVGLSAPVRFLTVGVLAAVGFLIAGLRGPMAAPPIQAQTKRETTTTAGGTDSNTANKAFDLTYLPAETRMFVAVRPTALLRRPEMQPVAKLLTGNEQLVREFLLPIDQIDQLLIFWESSPMNPANPAATTLIPPPSGVIVQSAKPQEWKQVLNRLAFPMEEVQHAGQTYLRPNGGQAGRFSMSLYNPDNRTAVLAADDLLRVLIEDRKEPKDRPSWNDAWSQVTKGQITAVLETRWLRRRLNQGEIKQGTIAPLLEKVRAYAASINVDRELKADLLATVGQPEDVKSVTETLQALLTLGRNSVPSLREQNAHEAGIDLFRESNGWAIGTLAGLLGKARIEATGQTVRLQTSSPVDEAKAAAVVVSYATTARTTSARVQSTNNLKQIGLALYNYAETNKHFPPPVLYGGKSGKVPYSWRVAILPFLRKKSSTTPTTSMSHGMGPITANCSRKCRQLMVIPHLAEEARRIPPISSSPARTPCWAREKSRPGTTCRMDVRSQSWQLRPTERFPGQSPRTFRSIPRCQCLK